MQPRPPAHSFRAFILATLTIAAAASFTTCGSTTSSSSCPINAAVVPSSATADHTAAPPGDQVQFSTVVTGTGKLGVCPLVIAAGSWTTSDPVNTAISNQPATQGLATCLDATPSPATITYTGMVYEHTFKPATLTCD